METKPRVGSGSGFGGPGGGSSGPGGCSGGASGGSWWATVTYPYSAVADSEPGLSFGRLLVGSIAW